MPSAEQTDYTPFLRSGAYPAMETRRRRVRKVLIAGSVFIALGVGAAALGFVATNLWADAQESAARAKTLAAGRPRTAASGKGVRVRPRAEAAELTLAAAEAADPAGPPSDKLVHPGRRVLPPAAAGGSSANQSSRPVTNGSGRPSSPPTAASAAVPSQSNPVRSSESTRRDSLDNDPLAGIEDGAPLEPVAPAPTPAAEGGGRNQLRPFAGIDDRSGLERPQPPRSALASPQPLAAGPGRPIAPPRPAALSARTDVQALALRGSLSVAVLRGAVERIRPGLSACYAASAQQAGHNAYGTVRVDVLIDEIGHARKPRVSGANLPGLENCVSSVASKLVTRAPDTGSVFASLTVEYRP
jgi:hypothetical protein